MFERKWSRGPFVFRCDGSAADYIETEETEFEKALATVKRAGWSAQYLGAGHGWCHFCPECTEAMVWVRTDRINGRPL